MIWFHGVGKSLASRKTSYAKLQKVSYSACLFFVFFIETKIPQGERAPGRVAHQHNRRTFANAKLMRKQNRRFSPRCCSNRGAAPPTFCHGVSLRRANCVRGNRRCTRALINTLDHTGVGDGRAREGVATANNNRRGILSFLASATLNFSFRLILGLATISKMWVC